MRGDNQALHSKFCQFTDKEWDWIVRQSLEVRGNMMEAIHRILERDMTGAVYTPPIIQVLPTFKEEDYLKELADNLEGAMGIIDQMNFVHDQVFVPNVNNLLLTYEQHVSLLEKGKQLTTDYIRRSTDA